MLDWFQSRRMKQIENEYLPELLKSLKGLNVRLDRVIVALISISGLGVFKEMIQNQSPQELRVLPPIERPEEPRATKTFTWEEI